MGIAFAQASMKRKMTNTFQWMRDHVFQWWLLITRSESRRIWPHLPSSQTCNSPGGRNVLHWVFRIIWIKKSTFSVRPPCPSFFKRKENIVYKEHIVHCGARKRVPFLSQEENHFNCPQKLITGDSGRWCDHKGRLCRTLRNRSSHCVGLWCYINTFLRFQFFCKTCMEEIEILLCFRESSAWSVIKR